jgi:hypothetical protein
VSSVPPESRETSSTASSAGDRTVYRWPRERLVGPLGFLVVGLGAGWVALAVVLALTGWHARTPYAVLAAVSLVALLLGGTLLVFPPAVLELSRDGYRLRHLRGGGDAAARWGDVRAVTTDDSTGGPVLVFEGDGGNRSVVPLALLGSHADDAQREVRGLLNTAHGYTPL